MLSLLWQICYIVGLIFSVANGKILKNNLTIWSQEQKREFTLHFEQSRCSSFTLILSFLQNVLKKLEMVG